MRPELMRPAYHGNIEALYELIHQDRPFAQTPLHVAVAMRHTNFALEIMRLKPSLSKKLNPNGWCPFHVALLSNQTSTVYRLLETKPELVCVKGREGFTSLLVENDNLNLLCEFLAVNPLSITDTTNRGQTALHIAVNKGNTRALNVLLSFLRRSLYREALYWEEKVLNWKDKNGDSVLL
ncbi:ankyrin repeat-containing protein [Gossypium australe]|uniref:Ankyrin repeat-containing protein n=1 Tax=Gossypium australe TaxID=47621 RepID=A0A5B6UHN6_9ROSI|nr:ankyrin repeat-containing protein [Gossypium australe]